MMGDIKIYHVETQEDYDGLMIKLENEGCVWASGEKPTTQDYWHIRGKETVVYLECWGDGEMTVGSLSEAKGIYHTTPIFKYQVNGAMDASKINIVDLNTNNKAKGVEQMEKVVVPKFVADWYEVWNTGFLGNKIAELEHASGRMEQWIDSLETDDRYGMEIAQEVIAKMHLYGYEVEEEKKYYWRKKKEHLLNCEGESYYYLNVRTGNNYVFLGGKNSNMFYTTKFTEIEVRKLVSEEDFSKLEKVEIEDV